MSSLAEKAQPGPLVKSIEFTDEQLCLHLQDGREIRVPLEFYPRLKKASRAERENYEILGGGVGIHWPEVDEDLSAEGILAGRPARF